MKGAPLAFVPLLEIPCCHLLPFPSALSNPRNPLHEGWESPAPVEHHLGTWMKSRVPRPLLLRSAAAEVHRLLAEETWTAALLTFGGDLCEWICYGAVSACRQTAVNVLQPKVTALEAVATQPEDFGNHRVLQRRLDFHLEVFLSLKWQIRWSQVLSQQMNCPASSNVFVAFGFPSFCHPTRSCAYAVDASVAVQV